MSRYKLTNTKRADKIISLLERLLSKGVFVELDSVPKFIKKLLLKTKNGKEYKLYHDTVNIIKNSQHKHPNLALNHYLADDHLSLDEAVFCILGLNPRAIEMIDNNPRNPANKAITSILLKKFIMQTSEGRGLYKAPRVGFQDGFISDGEDRVYTKGLIPWAIEKGFIEEVYEDENTDEANPQKSLSGTYDRDPETNIPLHRLEIYKETLPSYLESLNSPVSMRALTMPNDGKDGEYTLSIESRLSVGGSTTKKEIANLISKSSWWKSLPKSTRDKIKKQ